jgi:hypothetical protein
LESLGWIGEGRRGAYLERRRREFFTQKPRERRKMENVIFWCQNPINILFRAITRIPLPQAC